MTAQLVPPIPVPDLPYGLDDCNGVAERTVRALDAVDAATADACRHVGTITGVALAEIEREVAEAKMRRTRPYLEQRLFWVGYDLALAYLPAVVALL